MQANGRFTIAIHICIFMQIKGEGTLISSQTLAESVKTNPVVIRRIVSKLRDNEIVGSVAGAKGGFFLKRPAQKITLWDIYQAVRDTDLFYKPKKVNPECVVSSNLSFLVDDVYSEAELSMRAALEPVSVADLSAKLNTITDLESRSNFC
ncbi:MAG TPA: transcriptional regulator [Microscillaceae bacterium]|nr:transcriptional regulator [Microscillaceae bacterium]